MPQTSRLLLMPSKGLHMERLNKLIREYPELGDVLAEFETRLLRLENSSPIIIYPEPIKTLDNIDVRQLKYQVEQARSGYLHLQNKLNEHLDRKTKRAF